MNPYGVNSILLYLLTYRHVILSQLIKQLTNFLIADGYSLREEGERDRKNEKNDGQEKLSMSGIREMLSQLKHFSTVESKDDSPSDG